MITVSNTRAEAPQVALFAQLDDGNFIAEILDEYGVPDTLYWENAVDQVAVYIEPEDAELREILAALHEGRIQLSELEQYGGVDGGISTLPI